MKYEEQRRYLSLSTEFWKHHYTGIDPSDRFEINESDTDK
jgi:hypothetical protein